MKKEIFKMKSINKNIEKEEGYLPIPKDYCPECQKPMEKISNKFKCFKCGIEVELK